MSVIMTYLLHFLCLCNYENRMWFGMVELETGIPFVSALTFRYLCFCKDSAKKKHRQIYRFIKVLCDRAEVPAGEGNTFYN